MFKSLSNRREGLITIILEFWQASLKNPDMRDVNLSDILWFQIFFHQIEFKGARANLKTSILIILD